ncbi:hypothetical protein EMPG_14271 [Blastomyces silverae]|uniref:Uncharacterized protein n=1 Tax=Blastomyces silverae TaxID=2060906 RepID=A0A0H1BH66_9EURO|nr:hypothetical protein EMPG_14271 [Blastomyces silverae]
MVLATLKDCVIISMKHAMAPINLLEYATRMLNECSVISGYLDHNSENIANAAKLIVEQSHGLPTFERLLYNNSLTLFETYELVLENVVNQQVELAALDKKTLKIIMEAACPVGISQLMSALAPELASAASMQHLKRDLTEGEILEACLSSLAQLRHN